MQQMGWNQGKGLGRSEQGDVQHVRVKHKNDTIGILVYNIISGFFSKIKKNCKLFSRG